MRLLEAYVENFGVLHQYRIQPDLGLHVLCAPNGSGKSTFAAFLQAMFYGMPGSLRRELSENPRKKYQPWQGGTFGGWIEVDTRLGVLRIARTFAVRPRDDTLQLTDVRTGRQLDTPPEGIGQMLFGLDEESYARTVFLSSQGNTAPADGLHGQLRALLEGDEQPAACSDAIRRLETARKTLQPFRGTGGQIARLEQQIAETGRQWADAAAQAQTQETHQRTLTELQQQLQEADAQCSQCAAALTEAHRAAGGREELQRQLAAAQAFFPDGVPTEHELQAAEAAVRKLEHPSATGARRMPSAEECGMAREYARQARDAQQALDALVLPPEVYQRGKELERYFHGELPSASAVGQWKKQADLLRKYRRHALWLRLLGSAAGLLAAAAGSIAIWFTEALAVPGWAAWLVCAGLLLLGTGLWVCSFRPGKKIRFLIKLLTPVQQKYHPELPPAEAALEVAAMRAEWEQMKEQVRQLREAREQQAAARDEALYGLDVFFNEYGRPEGTPEQAIAALRMQAVSGWSRHPDGEDGLLLDSFWSRYSPDPHPRDFRAALQQIRTMWDRLAHLQSSLDHYTAACEAEALAQAQAEEARAHRAKVQEAIRQAQTRLDTARAAQSDAEELRERHAALREELQQAEHRRNLLDRTILWMQEAQDQLSVQYLEPMRSQFLVYFRQMFDPEAAQLTIDPGLRLTWTRSGGERPISCFSTGTRAAADVCIRLAMTDLLFPQERPLLILDDPFVHLDDDRLARAMAVLAELGEDTQILYFTCHTSREGDAAPASV